MNRRLLLRSIGTFLTGYQCDYHSSIPVPVPVGPSTGTPLSNLIHGRDHALLPRALRVGHDNDPLCHPVVQRLLAPALHPPDAQFPLELLDEAVLRVALVDDDRAQLAPQQPLPEHGVHIGGLFGAAND